MFWCFIFFKNYESAGEQQVPLLRNVGSLWIADHWHLEGEMITKMIIMMEMEMCVFPIWFVFWIGFTTIWRFLTFLPVIMCSAGAGTAKSQLRWRQWLWWWWFWWRLWWWWFCLWRLLNSKLFQSFYVLCFFLGLGKLLWHNHHSLMPWWEPLWKKSKYFWKKPYMSCNECKIQIEYFFAPTLWAPRFC